MKEKNGLNQCSIPIHTRVFQNLDKAVDKVIVDDRVHVKNFKYFNKYRVF